MFDMIKPYVYGAVGVLIAGLLASTMYFIDATSDAKVEAKGYQDSLTALELKVEARNKQEAADKANQALISSQNAVTGQKFLDTKRSVEGFKGREAVLRAKPTLTEKMINKSFANFADEISCTTGDATPCK